MYFVMFAFAAVAFLATNAKALPFVYTVQLLPSLYRLFRPRLFAKPKAPLPVSGDPGDKPPTSIASVSPKLFQTYTNKSRTILAEIDVNLHKSNSTFFVDADISRARLLTGLLGQALADIGPATPVLAAVQSQFRREILPYQAYWVSSRILAWNERSLYTVTYFLREDMPELPFDVDVLGGGPRGVLQNDEFKRGVFAVLVTKYVFKAGRKTVVPQDILLSAGLLIPTKDERGVGTLNRGTEALETARVESLVEQSLKYIQDSML